MEKILVPNDGAISVETILFEDNTLYKHYSFDKGGFDGELIDYNEVNSFLSCQFNELSAEKINIIMYLIENCELYDSSYNFIIDRNGIRLNRRKFGEVVKNISEYKQRITDHFTHPLSITFKF